jgi:tetratricopeptide (TPR) repeat protein
VVSFLSPFFGQAWSFSVAMTALVILPLHAAPQKLPQADEAKMREERLQKSLHDAPRMFHTTSASAAGLPRSQRWAMTFAALDQRNDLPKGVSGAEVPLMARQLLDKSDLPPLTRACALFIAGNLKMAEETASRLAKTVDDNELSISAWRIATYAAAEQGDHALAKQYLVRGLTKAQRIQSFEPWYEMQTEVIQVLQLLNEKGGVIAAMREMHEVLVSHLGAAHGRTLQWQNTLANTLYQQQNPSQAEKVFGAMLAVLQEAPEKNADQIKVIRDNLAKSITAQGRKADSKTMNFAVKSSVPNEAASVTTSVRPEDAESLGQRELQGIRLFQRQKFVEAVEQFRIVYEGRKRIFGPEHSQTLDAQNNLGSGLHELGQDREAVALLRDAVKISERLLPTDDLVTMERINNLANALSGLGDYHEAVKLHRRVAEVRRQVLGPNHPKTIDANNNLATELDDVGEPIEAEKLQRAVVAARQTVQGAEHPATLRARQTLTSLLHINGKNEEAEKECRSLLATAERVFGLNHADTLAVRCELANLLQSLGQYEEGKQQCQAAIDGCLIILGPENPLTLRCKSTMASLLLQAGNRTVGTADTRATLAITLKRHGPDHVETLEARTALAHQLQIQEDFAEAAKEYAIVISACRRLDLLTSLAGLNARNGEANNLRRQGKFAEAEEKYEPLVKEYTAILGADHDGRLDCLGNYGLVLNEHGKYKEALPVLKETLTKRIELHGERHLKVIAHYFSVAQVLEGMGRKDEAQMYMQKAEESSKGMVLPKSARRSVRPQGGFNPRMPFSVPAYVPEGSLNGPPVIQGSAEFPNVPLSLSPQVSESIRAQSPLSSPLLTRPPVPPSAGLPTLSP